jgi:hypothetical protein
MATNLDVATFSPAILKQAPAIQVFNESAIEAATLARREMMVRDAFQRGAKGLMKSANRESVQNSVQTLPGAGANTLKDAPSLFKLDARIATVEERFPRVFAGVNNVLRFGGVAAAVGGFGLSAYNLVTTWKKQTVESKALNTVATAASGISAVKGVQFLRGAASASRLMGAWMGVAGTITQGIQAFKEFQDPNKTAGQRGFATTAAVLSGIGTIACFIPGGQVIGFPLLIGAGLLGFAGDWLGKFPIANKIFSAIGSGISTVAGGLKNAASGVKHFFSHLF